MPPQKNRNQIIHCDRASFVLSRGLQTEGPGPRVPRETMGDMSAIVALQKAERLVSTVARAFYTDNTVLVVDTLIREK